MWGIIGSSIILGLFTTFFMVVIGILKLIGKIIKGFFKLFT